MFLPVVDGIPFTAREAPVAPSAPLLFTLLFYRMGNRARQVLFYRRGTPKMGLRSSTHHREAENATLQTVPAFRSTERYQS